MHGYPSLHAEYLLPASRDEMEEDRVATGVGGSEVERDTPQLSTDERTLQLLWTQSEGPITIKPQWIVNLCTHQSKTLSMVGSMHGIVYFMHGIIFESIVQST